MFVVLLFVSCCLFQIFAYFFLSLFLSFLLVATGLWFHLQRTGGGSVCWPEWQQERGGVRKGEWQGEQLGAVAASVTCFMPVTACERRVPTLGSHRTPFVLRPPSHTPLAVPTRRWVAHNLCQRRHKNVPGAPKMANGEQAGNAAHLLPPMAVAMLSHTHTHTANTYTHTHMSVCCPHPEASLLKHLLYVVHRKLDFFSRHRRCHAHNVSCLPPLAAVAAELCSAFRFS